jgi:hypothetical protein
MQLNPITNLPQDTNISSLDVQRRVLESYKQKSALYGANFGSTTPVQGAFGTYKPHQIVTSDRNFNEFRAQDQGYFELLGKSLMQTVGGVVAGGIISGVGFMADLPRYWNNLAFGEDVEFGDKTVKLQDFERNAISRLGKSIEDYFMNNFEIYQTERAQEGNLNPFSSESRLRDATFRTSMAPSIASTVALMVPAMGTAAALSGLARLGRLGVSGQRAVSTIGGALTSRHNYNMMEAYDLMDRRIEALQQQGMGYLEAKENAAIATSDFYKTAYANLWKDMISWGVLLRGFNYASRNATNTLETLGEKGGSSVVQSVRDVLRRNPGISAKDAVQRAGYNWKDWLLQSGLEGVEEFNIQFQKHVSERNSDIILGFEEGDIKGFIESYFSMDSLNELRTNKDIQNATLMGFFGGAAFQGFGQATAAFQNRNTAAAQAKNAEIFQQQIDYINTQLNTIEKASLEGDTETASLAEERLITNLAFSGLNLASGIHQGSLLQGDTVNNIEMFEAIANMSDEELSAIGRTNPKEAREQASRMAKKISEIAEIFNKNADRYNNGLEDTILNVFLTEQEFMNRSASERQGRLSEKLNTFYNQETILAASKQLKPEQLAEVKARAELYALNQVLKNKKELGVEEIVGNQLNIFRFNMMKRTRTIAIAKLEERITQLESSLPETQSAEVTEFIRNYLKSEEHNNIQSQKAYNDFLLDEGEATLADYVKTSTREEIIQAMQTSSEKLKDQVLQYTFSKKTESGDYIKIDNETYHIEKKGDEVLLTKYDLESQKLVGEQKPLSLELLKDDNYIILKADSIITTDKKVEVVDKVTKFIETDNLQGAVTELNKLNYSGMTTEYTALKTKLLEKITKKTEDITNLNDIPTLFFEVQSLNVELNKEIGEALKTQVNKIQAVITKELNELDTTVAKTEAKIEKSTKQLIELQQQSKVLKEESATLLSDFLKEDIEYNKLVEDRKLALNEAREAGATSKELAAITKQFNKNAEERFFAKLKEIEESDTSLYVKTNQQKLQITNSINKIKEDIKSCKK